MAERGRPTKLTPDVQNAICENIALAMPYKYAAEAEGIAERTFREWVEKDEAFSAAVTCAHARGLKRLVQMSLAGGRGSAAAQWHAERRFRNEYGPVTKLEHSGPDGKPIETNLTAKLDALSLDELRRLGE